jgi:hypothetical protein
LLKKKRALVCYICGKEYGTKRIENHLGLCQEKWEDEQIKEEPSDRMPCPQAPPGFWALLGKQDDDLVSLITDRDQMERKAEQI